jgi:hypothetical protein
MFFEHVLEPVVAKEGGKSGHAAPTAESKASHEPAAETSKSSSEAVSSEEHSPEVVAKERGLAGLSTLLAVMGIGIGFFLFWKTPLRKMPQILADKWRLDEYLQRICRRPRSHKLSTEGLVEGIRSRLYRRHRKRIGHFVSQFGNITRYLQVGFVRSYAAVIILGAFAVLGYFIYYGFKLVGLAVSIQRSAVSKKRTTGH